MAQITVQIPDELDDRIKRDIGRRAAETGNMQSKSEWWREAAREKLGDVVIEGGENNADEQVAENGGTS